MAAPAPPTASWSFSEENTTSPQVPGGDMTQNVPKTWERAWSVQEMRSEAGQWSLAGDAGLLLHLQEFSQRLISRTHEIGQEMDGLVHEVKLTSVQVNNVVNNFITLANSQFVENRVYDEDVSHEAVSQEENKSEQQEMTREQREAELMPRVTTALRLGMDVIETAFERIETAAVESDSEDEDNAYRADPILEAKDPYLTRTLPFLIGTPQFLEDDNVGLVEELSEDEEPESDHGSISASEDEQGSEDSETEYGTSEESGDETKQKARPRKQRAMAESDTSTDSQEGDSDEDMFAAKKPKKISGHDEESADASNSEEEDNEEYETAGPSAVATDFSSELAARLGVAASKPHTKGMDSDGGEGDDDDWENEHTVKKSKDTITSNKQKQSKETRQEKGREDAREKVDRGKGKGKHSKVKGEGDDLFGKSEQLDDDDFFGKPGGLFSTGKGLFDDDADADEGDLFGDVEQTPVKSKRKQTAERDDGSTLSDETKGEEEEEVHREKAVDSRQRTKSGKLLPKGAVSVFGPGVDFQASVRSDTSDTHIVIKPTAQPAAVPVTSGGEGGLFGDNDDDDALFGGVSHRRETSQKDVSDATRPRPTAATASKKVDLFADDDEEDDLFGSMAGPVIKRKSHSNVGLIVEDEMKEESPSDSEAPRKTAAPEKKLPPGAVSMFGDGPNPFVAALTKQQQAAASDEEDKDGWSQEETNSQSLTKPGGSATTRASEPARKLAPDDTHQEGDDEDDDFLPAKPTSNSKNSEKSAKNLPGNNSGQNLPQFDGKKTARDSLFDDADDEDSDFFTAATQPLGRKQPASVPVSSGVDASRADKGSQGKTSTTKASTQPPEGSTRSLSLFDDDEGEESAEPLFSSQQTPAAVKKDSSRRSSQDLFSNDDLLFAAREDENPSVDLFSSQGPLRQQSSPEKDKPRPSTASPAQKATRPSSRANTASLFGGGDDDDDDGLFAHGGLTKLPSAAPPSRSVADATESKPAGGMESKEEEPKPDVNRPKKPAGAVSMFGGLDPSAILKKRRPPSASDDEKDKDDEKQEKKEEKEMPVKEETPQEKSPAPMTSKLDVNLFAREDGDDKSSDDLLSPNSDAENKVEGVGTGESTDTPDKEEAEQPKPEPTRPKKPAGAVSMFGGLDPSVFLKKRKVEEPEENDDDDEKDREKPATPEPAPKTAPKPKLSVTINQDSTRPKPPGDLFGKADEDDSDDLFGAPKKKVPPPTATRTPVATPTEPSKSEEELSGVEPAKPRMPAGAVPMFGGINPFAGLKKKSVSIEEDETEPSPSREELKSPTSSPILLSPDGTHPKTLERGDSVDFEQPAEADPLTTAIKDRPKLNRRRPQSRKARMLAATHTGISFEDVTPTTPTTPTIPEDVESLQELPSPNTATSPRQATDEPSGDNKNNDSGADKSVKPQTKSADLFGNDDLLDGPSLSAGMQQAGGDEQSVKGDPFFRKDLFAGKSTKSSLDAGNDLFSDSSTGSVSASIVTPKASDVKSTLGKASKTNKQDDLFSTSQPGRFKPSDVSVVLDSDDLHSPPPVSAGQKLLKATSGISHDEDDLFASSSVKSPTVRSSKSKPGSDDIQTTKPASAGQPDSSEADATAKSNLATSPDDGDDDIFKDSSLDKRTGASKKSVARNTAARNDDSVVSTSKKSVARNTAARNDDSVVSASSRSPRSSRPHKAVTKEAKLFSDATDIFSDIPAATPREAKTKPAKKASEKKVVHKDDVDDIFAETSAAGIKPKNEPKNEPKKKTSKSAAVDSANIFDDRLS